MSGTYDTEVDKAEEQVIDAFDEAIEHLTPLAYLELLGRLRAELGIRMETVTEEIAEEEAGKYEVSSDDQ